MRLQRVILVLVSLLLFTVTHITLFGLFELTPDQTPKIWESGIYLIGMIPISFTIGLLTAKYDNQTRISIKISASTLLTISLISLMQEGSKWSQLTTIIILIPTMFGGVWGFNRYHASQKNNLPLS